MLSDDLLSMYGRALHGLGFELPILRELVGTRAQACGERVSGGSGPGSKPPLNLALLELLMDVESTLRFWATHLGGVLGLRRGSGQWECSTSGYLDLLLAHTGDLEGLPFAELLCHDVIAKANVVAQVVDEHVTPAPGPVAVFGSPRQVSLWLKREGLPVSHMRIRRAIESGQLRSYEVADRRVLVAMADARALFHRPPGLDSVTPRV